jgi:hypothetical protein
MVGWTAPPQGTLCRHEGHRGIRAVRWDSALPHDGSEGYMATDLQRVQTSLGSAPDQR